MKKIILALILGLLTGCSVGISNTESSVNEQIKIAIYPTGVSSETYYFILNHDGELIAEKGTRVGNDITQNTFIKDRVEIEKKYLSSSDVSKIYNLSNEVYEDDVSTNTIIVQDGWDVQIFYKDKIIKQNYNVDIPPQIKDLVDELINVSPVKVDLHGWS